jgi:adenylosuccinate lyase
VEVYACKKLGLTPAPASSQVVQRDRHAEYFSALALLGASIEKFAVEIRHLQRTEVREVEEHFTPGQKGSSAMPHKRNPILSENLTGLARLLRGYAVSALEDVALWHERDISHSSVERVILPDSSLLAYYVLRRMAQLIERLEVRPQRMLENLDASHGLVFSQPVLLALVAGGLTRDEAYRVVQDNAMRAWQERTPFRTLLEKDPRVTLDEAQLDEAFSLERALRHAGRVFDALDGVE